MTPSGAFEERLLVLAPHGRDAEVIADALVREGFACAALDGIEALLAGIDAGAAGAIIADEALEAPALACLMSKLARQEPWSDFPLVLLVSRPIGRARAGKLARQADLGNVIQLERPLNVETLCSAAGSALRARRRQYQARDMLVERERASERLRASQDELVQLNETLEVRIEERTRALAQANDRLTKEIIERERALQAVTQLQKMEAIGRLTGGIAHDFNNLLNVVQGNMDLILMVAREEQVKKRAEVARNACRRGAKLTSQLLAFSRDQSLDLRAVPVGALFAGIRELVATSVGSSVSLSYEVASGVDSVMADSNQIEMALLNLAINARDAMPRGGMLRFRALRSEAPPGLLPAGDYVCIAVSDSGTGMSEELVAKVFEPFFTTKGVGKGTGLGLSQVYGMAQQSGGAARIRSTEHVGTTVEIWLRAAAAHAGDDAQASAAPAPVRAGACILVVEDDDFVRASIVDSLQALGHRVSQAANGGAALAQVSSEAPDLLITDYMMPGMTGVELVKRVRALHPQLPMIIATGYADMKAIEETIGDDNLLRKPFQLADLAASVERALARRAS
jgi:signal transduction histidine kinase/CheY-like chemotaxis protein